MFKRAYRKLKIGLVSIQSGYFYIMRFVRTNILVNRLVSFLICIALVGSSFMIGYHHKHKKEYIKAMTVSDIHQSLEFSKTGTGFTLYPQKRNDDLTVLPFKLESTENQGVNAKDYLVSLMPLTKEKLPSNIKTSIMFFGDEGEGVIAIKGKLPKAPVSVTIRNDSNFSSDENGSGKVEINGETRKINYNGVTFTINAKAKNVKVDKRLNPDMPIKNLYSSVFADKEISKIKKKYKSREEKQDKITNKIDDYQIRIKKINKALDKDENDMEYDNSVDEDENSSVTVSDLDEATESSSISNTDVRNRRNNAIDEVQSLIEEYDQTEDEKEALKTQEKQINDYKDNKVYHLLSMNSESEIRENNDVK